MKSLLSNIDAKSRYELRDAARILGVSPSTLSRWAQKGVSHVQHRRVNRRRVWTGEELIRLWKSHF